MTKDSAERIKLTDRDSHNHSHFIAAHKIIFESTIPLHMTTRTRKEVGNFPELLYKNTKIETVKAIPATGSVAICAFYHIERGLILSDNVIIRCDDCRTVLQGRPEIISAAEKICVFCAAERVLNGEFEAT